MNRGWWVAIVLLCSCESPQQSSVEHVEEAARVAAEARGRAAEARWAELNRQRRQLEADFTKLADELSSLEGELDVASSALNDAQTEAERKAARDRLAKAEARKVELQAIIARKQAELREAERRRKVILADSCKDNPLGCS
jgi:chromosome segregation ATPase